MNARTLRRMRDSLRVTGEALQAEAQVAAASGARTPIAMAIGRMLQAAGDEAECAALELDQVDEKVGEAIVSLGAPSRPRPVAVRTLPPRRGVPS